MFPNAAHMHIQPTYLYNSSLSHPEFHKICTNSTTQTEFYSD